MGEARSVEASDKSLPSCPNRLRRAVELSDMFIEGRLSFPFSLEGQCMILSVISGPV